MLTPARITRGLWRRASRPFRLPARYDRQTKRIIRKVLRPDSATVDVGAHTGSVLRHLVACAPEGQHYAFEPLPGYAESLRQRFPAVRVCDVALSDAAGTASFQHDRTHPGWSGFRRLLGDSEVEEIVVRTARLDDILPPALPIRFVKIDVEGAEMAVLRGAERTLRRWRPFVLFEHEAWAAPLYGTTPEAVFDFFAAAGLSISRLADWLHGRSPLAKRRFAERHRSRADFYFLAHR